MTDMEVLIEDSLDGGPPSVGSGEIPTTVVATTNNTLATPTTSKKKPNKNKIVTGYILYSREVRKNVVQNNPDSNFGEISRLVGNEWRSLPTNEKQVYEEKASKINEETKALLLLNESKNEDCASPGPPVDQVYECLWDGCDFQFEEVSDLIDHCVKDKDVQGHVQSYFQTNSDSELNCMWRTCGRINKKNIQPFPNLSRLIRHVRDMHINKGNGRNIPPADRSKNFKPSSKPANVTRPTPSATPNPPVAVTQPQEPLFISIPPRPQRVLHSEAYIKYIEGLQTENKYISPWEKTLNATRENTAPLDTEKFNLVSTWLGKTYEQQDDALNALWELRNQLLRDSLGIVKANNNF